jgi:hypothetical protein
VTSSSAAAICLTMKSNGKIDNTSIGAQVTRYSFRMIDESVMSRWVEGSK